jgi:NAD(P)-dependent dehydrogenase (short-subunit alcohol dehydrogenase family)
MRLKDKVAVVTGGANGIGRAIALNFAREGASIVIADIDLDGGRRVVKEIKALKRGAIAVKTDVTRREDINRMVKATLDEFGVIDILVNNAGGGAREKRSLFAEEAEEMTDIIIARNLKSTLNCSRAVINHMIERRSGKIVNIASVCGINGVPKEVTFSAAKAGVIIFTRALAMEVGSYGINVNCVSPGAIDTPLAAQARAKTRETAKFKMGKPEDIAGIVTFLASDEASFINGQNYAVTGVFSLFG